MSWSTSVVVGLLSAVVGAVAAGFVATLAVDWYQVTSREGASGYFIVFMALIGAANYLVNAQSVYAWTLVTLLVSLLHYAYDGLIWRAKATAAK